MSLLNSNDASLHEHISEHRNSFLEFENQDRRNKPSRSPYSSSCQIDKVQQGRGFFSERHDIRAFEYSSTLPPRSTTHTEPLLLFCSSVSSHKTLFFHAQKARRSFIWYKNVLSLQKQLCCWVKTHSSIQSISHYDRETFVQWGSLRRRPTSSASPPITHITLNRADCNISIT